LREHVGGSTALPTSSNITSPLHEYKVAVDIFSVISILNEIISVHRNHCHSISQHKPVKSSLTLRVLKQPRQASLQSIQSCHRQWSFNGIDPLISALRTFSMRVKTEQDIAGGSISPTDSFRRYSLRCRTRQQFQLLWTTR